MPRADVTVSDVRMFQKRVLTGDDVLALTQKLGKQSLDQPPKGSAEVRSLHFIPTDLN